MKQMNMRSASFPPVALALALCGACLSSTSAEPDFEKDIVPLLAKRCLECHNAGEKKGEFDLSSRKTAYAGGESGPALGKPGDSHLLKRITRGEMPPKSSGQSRKLPENEIALFREWIAGGAQWPEGRFISLYEHTTEKRAGLDWWSLKPVERPEVPELENAARIVNPIDAFIGKPLEENKLEAAPEASRRVLVRRACFDLLGLPPTREQASSFVNDDSPEAWEKLIDSLLKSRHYGERWARYWLDLVRFAETCGYERDQLKPNIWKYRDWVIRALNEDMAYDRFVTDQLAGDEVPYRDEQSVIATGMLRAGTWNDEPNDTADYIYTRLEDMVHTTTSAFIGLTVKCARCHDHKFDPIQQTDYYRTASFFWAGYIGQPNLGGPSAKQLGFNVFGWTDKGPHVNPIRLLVKGDRHREAQVVEPGFLSAVPELEKPVEPPPAGSRTTRRRLQFARWITHPENPLTARVLVNRLWLHHFGEGIVRTPNNFGFKSAPPSHPKLLDWLAAEALAGGWKLKRLHKLIMMSATYRQSSVHPRHAEFAQRDYSNHLLWRFNRRRLDAEARRDATLAASGRLNKKMGGPSFFPLMSPEALEGLSRKATAWGSSPVEDRSRRSIYMMSKRSRLLPLMTTFDFCDTTLSCGQRDVSLVPTQALALLNNQFIHEQSRAMAERVTDEAGDDRGRQIRLAWQFALGRLPDENEAKTATAHLESQARLFENRKEKNLPLVSLCHVLLNTNEFIFVD